jgi:hypothetical protein
MTEAQRQRALKELAEIDAELNQIGQTTPPAGVGAGGPTAGTYRTQPEPLQTPVVPEIKGTAQKVTEFAAPIAASMYGAKKGMQIAAPVAAIVPSPVGKAVVLGGAAIAGATTAGAGADLSLSAIKYSMGLPGAPDSFDEALQSASGAAYEQGAGELIGRTVIGPAVTRISPFRRAMTPESAELMKSTANRIRATYEEIGGKPLVEDTRRWWNPGRIAVPLETELKDNAVYDRLRAAGLEPEVARKVAITGGAVPSRLDATITSRYWEQVSGSQMVADEAYERARAKLLHYSTLKDLGSSFADSLPPEKMGEAVIGAVSGRFDTLNGMRDLAMHTLETKLPKDLKLDISGLRKSLGAPRTVAGPAGMTIAGPMGPGATRKGANLIIGLPDKVSFGDLNTQRTALATMSRDKNIPPPIRDDIKRMIVEVDNATRDALPVRMRGHFRKWTNADDEVNKAGFDSWFVEGMLHKEENARAVAERIIRNKDAKNFAKLEDALGNTTDGKRIIGQVRSSVADRFFAGSVNKNGVLQPNMLATALGTETKGYGKYFLEATLGDDYVKSLNRYIKSMQTIDEATAKMGNVIRGGATMTGVAFGVNSLLRGAPGVMGATVPATITAALFSPAVVAKALTHPQASKLLVKVAENVAAGRNPMTTSRIAGRVLEMTGFTPEQVFGGAPVTPRAQAAEIVQRGVIGGGVPTGQPLPMTGGTPLPGT